MKIFRKNLVIFVIIIVFAGYQLANLKLLESSKGIDTYAFGTTQFHYLDYEPIESMNSESSMFAYADKLVVDTYNGFKFYDIKNPSSIELLRTLEYSSNKITILGDRLFIKYPTNYNLYGDLMNISDITNIIDIQEDFVFPDYVANNIWFQLEDNQLQVYNCSDIYNPISIHNYSAPSLFTSFSKIDVVGNYAYILENDGISILNITNYTSIELISDIEFRFSYGSNSYVVDENLIYVSGYYGTEIYNITDKSNPVLLKYYKNDGNWGSKEPTWQSTKMEIFDDVMLSIDSGFIFLLNISDPLNIKVITANYELNTFNWVIYGDFIYFAGAYRPDPSGEGIEYTGIYSLKFSETISGSDLTFENQVKHYETNMYNASDVHITNTKTYVANWDNGITCYDDIDKSNLKEIWTIPTAGNANIVDKHGDLIIVGEGENGIEIFKDNGIQDPYLIGNYDTDGYVHSIEVVGNYIYIADGSNGMVILNIIDPFNPLKIGNITSPTSTIQVKIGMGYAYTVESEYGLRIIDLSNYKSPTVANSYTTTYSTITHIEINENTLVMGLGSFGMKFFNIENPTKLVLYKTFQSFDGDVLDFSMDETSIVCNIKGKGIHWFMINKTLPIFFASYSLSFNAGKVNTINGFVYLASGVNGLNIITYKSWIASDIDNDGLTFMGELWNFNTNIYSNDTDSDGMSDGYEATRYIGPTYRESNFIDDLFYSVPYLDPTISDGDLDQDKDGLTSKEEYKLGTDAVLYDTDKDGVKDGDEISYKTDPLNYDDTPEVFDWSYLIFIFVLTAFAISSYLKDKGLLKRKAPLNAFLSHAVVDYETYYIKEMADTLGETKEINKGFYCEQDMRGNIDDWMDEVVPISDIFIFLATKKSVFNSPDCAREIRLANEYGLYLVPIRTDEVTWADIAQINLPDSGFDYVKKRKKLYQGLKDYLTEINDRIQMIELEMEKADFIILKTLDIKFQLQEGESLKLAKIILKNDKVDGVITKDGIKFLSKSEVKKLVKNYQKQSEKTDMNEIIDFLDIDKSFKEEVIRIAGIKVKNLTKNKKSEEDGSNEQVIQETTEKMHEDETTEKNSENLSKNEV